MAEDDGAKQKIVSLLADRDEDLSIIKGTLKGKQHSLEGFPSFVLTLVNQSKSRDLQMMSLGKRTIKKCWGPSYNSYRHRILMHVMNIKD